MNDYAPVRALADVIGQAAPAAIPTTTGYALKTEIREVRNNPPFRSVPWAMLLLWLCKMLAIAIPAPERGVDPRRVGGTRLALGRAGAATPSASRRSKGVSRRCPARVGSSGRPELQVGIGGTGWLQGGPRPGDALRQPSHAPGAQKLRLEGAQRRSAGQLDADGQQRAEHLPRSEHRAEYCRCP